MRELGFPVVATSGNLTDEPICTDNDEARDRLGEIADFFLMHDRPIVRPMDDSVLAVCAGAPVVMRRGRGLAPYSLPLPGAPDGWVGAGAQMKGAVAVTAGGNATMSAHLGDLDHEGAARLWARAVDDLTGLHGLRPVGAAADLHPDYVSTRGVAEWACRWSERAAPPRARCGVHGGKTAWRAVLGIAWDGTGLGPDGTIGGGEFLVCTRAEFRPRGVAAAVSARRGDAAARSRAVPPGACWGDGFAAAAARIRRGGTGGAGGKCSRAG
jgi:hydrogenase maturation protein HypF